VVADTVPLLQLPSQRRREAASAEANHTPAVIPESIHEPIAQICPA